MTTKQAYNWAYARLRELNNVDSYDMPEWVNNYTIKGSATALAYIARHKPRAYLNAFISFKEK